MRLVAPPSSPNDNEGWCGTVSHDSFWASNFTADPVTPWTNEVFFSIPLHVSPQIVVSEFSTSSLKSKKTELSFPSKTKSCFSDVKIPNTTRNPNPRTPKLE